MVSIPGSTTDQLTSLLFRDDGITSLNIIRDDQKNFKYTAVKTEVEKAQRIAELYTFTIEFIPLLQ